MIFRESILCLNLIPYVPVLSKTRFLVSLELIMVYSVIVEQVVTKLQAVSVNLYQVPICMLKMISLKC